MLKEMEVNLKENNIVMVNRLAAFNNEIESKQSLIRFYNVELESLNNKERELLEKFQTEMNNYDSMLSHHILSNKSQEEDENLLKSKSVFSIKFLDDQVNFNKIKELESILLTNMEKNKYEFKDITELINNVIHKIKTIKGFHISKNQIKEQMNLLENDTVQLDYIIKLFNDKSAKKEISNTMEIEKIQHKALTYLDAQNFIMQMNYLDFNNIFGRYSKLIHEIIRKFENSNKFLDKNTDTIDSSSDNLNTLKKERIFNIKINDIISMEYKIKDKYDYTLIEEISKLCIYLDFPILLYYFKEFYKLFCSYNKFKIMSNSNKNRQSYLKIVHSLANNSKILSDKNPLTQISFKRAERVDEINYEFSKRMEFFKKSANNFYKDKGLDQYTSNFLISSKEIFDTSNILILKAKEKKDTSQMNVPDVKLQKIKDNNKQNNKENDIENGKESNNKEIFDKKLLKQ